MKALQDYSFIRGFCYPGGAFKPEEQIRRELGYAKRLELNSTRIWLSERKYREDPRSFIEQLMSFVRIAYELGITVMPVLFNGNGLDPADLEEDYRPKGDEYTNAVVNALKDEPGLIMWDIMNEPSCNDYIIKSPPDERAERWDKINGFVRYYCNLLRGLDPVNAVTIGHTYIGDAEPTVDLVDIISFHDYLPTRRRIEASYIEAAKLSKKTRKPMINNELCCLCRGNPYDLALDICREYNTGWYLFELMISGYWSDVHGIFYPDGTVRDPSIPAAVMGFSRNRSAGGYVLPNANKEGHAQKAIEMVKDALQDNREVFIGKTKPIEEILEAAEYCANLLECCELVPMYNPPTRQIEIIRESGNVTEAQRLAYSLAKALEEACMLL